MRIGVKLVGTAWVHVGPAMLSFELPRIQDLGAELDVYTYLDFSNPNHVSDLPCIVL